MPVIFQKRVYREDLRRNKDLKYLFGDNENRAGYGGQAAEMRGEPNALGVRTKRSPNNSIDSFWTDDRFDALAEMISVDLEPAFVHLLKGGILVIPSDGLGTGLSELPQRAPRVNNFLESMLKTLRGESTK